VLCSHWYVLTFEIFTSSAEESNPELLPSNAFPRLIVLQNALAAGLCCADPAEGACLQRSPKLLAESEGAAKRRRKEKDVKELWREIGRRMEGKMGRENGEGVEVEGSGEGGEKENLTLYSFCHAP